MENLAKFPVVRKSILYEKLDNSRVKCGLCERRCTISPGERGFCRTRTNVDGELVTLVYGDLSALESRPIEIKPFFHYWPGSTALTFSTWSCNFDCPWCQNFPLSKAEPHPKTAHFFPPEGIVEMALRSGNRGLCASFQEPTLLTDWVLPLFELGRERGLYCCYVSNGYMTLEALRRLRDVGMDGLKIDVKGDQEVYQRYCGGLDVAVVWRNAREAKKLGCHVEIVNLIIPGVNDGEESLGWLVQQHLREVGPETPLHFTRYQPAYRFTRLQTRVETLEEAYKTAKKEGVRFPYIGNVPGHRFEHTYCPDCGELLVKRYSYGVIQYRLARDNRCPKCGSSIPVKGEYCEKL